MRAFVLAGRLRMEKMSAAQKITTGIISLIDMEMETRERQGRHSCTT
jgi:hypothetical protein